VQATPRETELRHQIIELDQMAFGEARKIFSQSRTVADRLKRYNGFESKVVYPPLNDSDQLHFQDLEDFVLSVSRLAANKRVPLLIEAMQFVSHPFKAIIIGEGNLREDYEKLALKTGVADRVIFTGKLPREQVIDFYSRAGVVFYCPVDEDYGYVTLEAFHSRKPLITCQDSGGTLEFVDDSCGWISNPDPQDVARCIEDALTNKANAREKGNAGNQKISYINWNYVFDHLLGD
jgi:glycosyltransferase involved in cell wall biosynthesis